MRVAIASHAVDTHRCLLQMSSVMPIYPVRSSACFDIIVNAHLVPCSCSFVPQQMKMLFALVELSVDNCILFCLFKLIQQLLTTQT